MVLWKRESTSSGDCYVNLLTESKRDKLNYQFDKLTFDGTNKDDDKSTECRIQGDEQSKALNWFKAMEFYNQSLRFAPNGSENISLAYANRSACFRHLQFYNECLADIELAKTANYPQRLMHKLAKREAKCLELMNEKSKRNEIKEVVLSYAPNEQFPCLANVLDIQSNDEFGKHIVATQDIDIGLIILVEDAFAHGVLQSDQTLCETCLKSVKSFIPCPNCAEHMFCDFDCMNSNRIHEMVCGTSFNHKWHSTFIIKSVLFATTAFPNVECLMAFVESALSTRDFDTPECDTNAQAKYRMFLKLFALTEELNEATEREVTSLYRTVMGIPEIKQRFHSEQAKRFLMHLIWQHRCIVFTNGFEFETSNKNSGIDQDVYVMATFSSLFSHSCYPNAGFGRQNNKQFVYTCRPVKKGEQLFIKYRSADIQDETEFQHTGMGKDYRFQCKCSKCIPQWKEADRKRIQSDADFSFLQNKVDPHQYCKNPKLRSMLTEKLLQFLKKYGQLPWTTEIEFVMELFYCVLKAEYTDLYKI